MPPLPPHDDADPQPAARSSAAEDIWAAPELDIDEDALTERAETLIIDRDTRLLARANRLALIRDRVARHTAVRDGADALDIPLRCVAHAHPDCRFRWVRITLDLSPTPGAAVSDLSPRDKVAEHPVKITTTYHGGLSFNIAHLPVKSELTGERTTERDVYFPTITSSGIGLAHAIWDFTAPDGTPLHLDRQLRLLAAVPSGTDQSTIRLTLRAAITAKASPAPYHSSAATPAPCMPQTPSTADEPPTPSAVQQDR